MQCCCCYCCRWWRAFLYFSISIYLSISLFLSISLYISFFLSFARKVVWQFGYSWENKVSTPQPAKHELAVNLLCALCCRVGVVGVVVVVVVLSFCCRCGCIVWVVAGVVVSCRCCRCVFIVWVVAGVGVSCRCWSMTGVLSIIWLVLMFVGVVHCTLLSIKLIIGWLSLFVLLLVRVLYCWWCSWLLYYNNKIVISQCGFVGST